MSSPAPCLSISVAGLVGVAISGDSSRGSIKKTPGQSLDCAYSVRLSATIHHSAAGILARLGIKAPGKHAFTLCLSRSVASCPLTPGWHIAVG